MGTKCQCLPQSSSNWELEVLSWMPLKYSLSQLLLYPVPQTQLGWWLEGVAVKGGRAVTGQAELDRPHQQLGWVTEHC